MAAPSVVSDGSFEDFEMNLLAKVPEFGQLERSGVIPESTTRPLAMLVASRDTVTIRDCLCDNNSCIDAVLQCLRRGTADAEVNPFLVAFLIDAARKDTMLWDVYVKQTGLAEALDTCLSRNSSSFLFQRTAFFLAGLMGHTPNFPPTRVQVLLNRVREKDNGNLTLEVTAQLVKQSAFRMVVWQDANVRQTLKDTWVKPQSEAAVYKACFILWVLSMDADIFAQVCSTLQVVAGMSSALKDAKAERIVRLLVALAKNCIEIPALAAQILELQISSTLSSLEYEKWKDPELYNEIRDVIGKIESCTLTHSNIARYEVELDSGRLAWSHIHSEKFWHDNCKSFENKDFVLIKRLVTLLESSADPTTLAVACFDIGEFARLHPIGKKLLSRFDAKAHVMNLMSHSNREVAREALLCTQKLMLNNWQQVSA